jgi:hypothetical protein
MKLKLAVALLYTTSLSFHVYADQDEDAVQHAAFAAFQEPGVFSADYIAAQRQVLLHAARQGNRIALIVTDRNNIKAVGSLPDSDSAPLVSN